jgi:hypothetical protein
MQRKLFVICALAIVAGMIVRVAMRHVSSSPGQSPPSLNTPSQPANNFSQASIAAPVNSAATMPAALGASYLGIDESLTRLPPLPPATSPAVPVLPSLVGQWSGKMTAVALDDDVGSALIDPASLKPFTFTIVKQGDEFVLRGIGDASAVRVLKTTVNGVVARSADGRGDIELTMEQQVLVGHATLPAPRPGRLEFHATHAP